MFSQEEFNNFILENKVIKYFEEPIRLRSGKLSHWYFNWRDIADDVFLLDKLTGYIIDFTKDLGLKPDCFYGVPEGATKIGLFAQERWAKSSLEYGRGSHSLPMGRGKPKRHGIPKDRNFIGEPKGKTIILEDVTTTGKSLIKAIDSLIETDAVVIAAYGLTNWMETGKDGKSVEEIIQERGIPFYYMSNAYELVPRMYKKLKRED